MWTVKRKFNDGYESWTTNTWEFQTYEEADSFRDQMMDENTWPEVWFIVDYEHPYNTA